MFVLGTSVDSLECQLTGLHAIVAGAQHELLRVIAELDRLRAYADDGARDMVEWLAMRLALERPTARRLVETAVRAAELPELSAAFARGELSLDQLAAACRFATPELDATIALLAIGLTPAQIDALGEQLFPPTCAEADAESRRRAAWLRWTDRRRVLHISARLPAESGLIVEGAIRRLALTSESPEAGPVSFPARCADALVTLATTFNAECPEPERASVIVHVDALALDRPDGAGALLEGAGPVALETARRLACDAHRQTIIEGEDGMPILVGRTQRTVPPWLLRALHRRDRHCRFPGCQLTRHLHAHHIRHWVRGGATDAGNLVLLCGRHHRFVHEAGWSIHGNPSDALVFKRPDRSILRAGPPRSLTPLLHPR